METQIHLSVAGRESFAHGIAFGEVGAYERLWGSVEFAVDPDDPAYRSVVDLEHAPRRADGRVVFSTDLYVLKPIDMARGNRRLFYEVNNRGTKLMLQFLNDAVTVERPCRIEHAGNGYLMRRGYTLVWSGWQGDILPGEGRLAMRVPIARQGNVPITGTVRTEFAPGYEGTGYTRGQIFDNREGLFSIPLSGNPYTASYEATSLDPQAASLTYREYEDDPPIPIPPGDWEFARIDLTGGRVPSPSHCLLPGGFRRGWIYELTYTARNPLVLGLGFTGLRDLIAHLRHASEDDAGNANPLAAGGGIDKAYGWGCSQSARFLREFVYRGFNADRQGRPVFEGICPFVSGAGRVTLNYRFAQPGRYPRQHYDQLFPSDQFPFAYPVIADPLTGATDGILKRPDTDPLVLHTQSSSEYWQRRGSLVHTEPLGADLADHPGARVYLLAAAEHAADPLLGPTEDLYRHPTNCLNVTALLRALQDALDEWVTDEVAPPESLVPTHAHADLHTAEQVGAAFPAIPGVSPPAAPNRLFVQDHGVDFARGVLTEPPVVDAAREYAVRVPAVDADGNEICGIRGPDLAVPRATYTGWNFRKAGEAPESMAAVHGSTLAFTSNESQRAANQDPRPSLQARYPTRADYVRAITAAARALVEQRLLLEEDFERVVQRAASTADQPPR